MHLTTEKEEATFREEVRDWLSSHIPRSARPTEGDELRSFDLEWQREQYAGGWAGISWPKEYGGRGLTLEQQVIWCEENARAGAPVGGCMFIALTHAGPTLIARGTETQRQFHLGKILRGEAMWCQGFSEPNAGSDLAGIKTHARIDGDHLVVNGSKIWTSYAYLSEYQELLVRTDPSAPKHKGLTWVIGDMRLPGITIRRIPTASGTGNLCEVFYDEVRIPLANVVGSLHDGWSVSMTTLGFERGTAFIHYQIDLAATVDKLVKLAGQVKAPDGRRTAIQDDEIASRLAGLRVAVSSLRAMSYMSVSRGLRNAVPGVEGNIVALFYAELSKRIYAVAVELEGMQALHWKRSSDQAVTRYLDAFKNTIAGGTSEIRRNVIGERMLGLPRSAR